MLSGDCFISLKIVQLHFHILIINWNHKATEICRVKRIPSSKGTEQAAVSGILRVYAKLIYAYNFLQLFAALLLI